jgi:hypothetical protein
MEVDGQCLLSERIAGFYRAPEKMEERLYVPACERSYAELSEPSNGGCHVRVRELSLSRSSRFSPNAVEGGCQNILPSTLIVTIN